MTQPIRSPWGVSVQATATVAAVPDTARLRLTCKRNRPTPAQVFADIRRAAAAVRAVLRAHGVADKQVSASQLKLESATLYKNGVYLPNGFDSSVTFTVELRDLDALESVLIAAVDAGVDSVGAVEFDVSTKDELRAEAHRKAVQAARAKAELYAEAAGARLGRVVHIEDVPAEQRVDPYRSRSSQNRDAAVEDDGDSDLRPGRITLQASVRVGYALED